MKSSEPSPAWPWNYETVSSCFSIILRVSVQRNHMYWWEARPWQFSNSHLAGC